MSNAPQEIIERVRAMFEVANTGYAKLEDVGRLFLKLTNFVKEVQAGVDAKIKTASQTLASVLRKETTDAVKKSEEATGKKITGVRSALTTDIETVRADVRAVRNEIPTIPAIPSLAPLWEKLQELASKIPLPMFAEDIRNYLELLEGDERLDVSAIRGLDKLLEEAKKGGKTVTIGGGPRGMQLYVGGVKKGLISNLNLVAGSGMAIAYSKVNGQDTLTFSVSGSGITVETPPEPANAVTIVFTVSGEPQWIVQDGTTLFEGVDTYTYDAMAGEITTAVAPSSSIRVII